MSNVSQRLGEAIGVENRGAMTEFSRKCGESVSTLRSWIIDGRDIPSSKIQDLAKAAGVDPLWLLTGESRENPAEPIGDEVATILGIQDRMPDGNDLSAVNSLVTMALSSLYSNEFRAAIFLELHRIYDKLAKNDDK